MTHKILVTGATGTIGKAIVRQLEARQIPFVAGVRDLRAGKTLKHGELATFDFSKPETFEQATAGVDGVFLLGPPLTMNLDELLTPFIHFLKKRKINRVVYLAALGLDNVKELPFHTNVISLLEKEGFNYTILKPAFFSQNFKNYEWENITQRGITYVPAGSGKVAFIDVNDIASVAVEALTSGGHEKKTYELTGPETLSFHEAANLLSETTGRKIVYPSPTPEAFADTLKASGAPDFIAPYMINVYSMIANNQVDVVTDTVEKITGKKPASLKKVLAEDFSSAG